MSMHACSCLCCTRAYVRAVAFACTALSSLCASAHVLPACSTCIALLMLGCQELFFALLCLLMLGLPGILPFPLPCSFSCHTRGFTLNFFMTVCENLETPGNNIWVHFIIILVQKAYSVVMLTWKHLCTPYTIILVQKAHSEHTLW